MLRDTLSGLSSGLIISIGGCVFLSCDNRYVGAVLFSVALICICFKGYNLFTGKVCYMLHGHGKNEWQTLLAGLLGNFCGTLIFGYAARFGMPALGEAALGLCAAKLEQSFLQTLIRGFFCGVLIYLAVSIFRESKSALGIVFCIPVFILSGFEHSIADMFYFSASGLVSMRAFAFIWTVILGNITGGLFLPLLELTKEKANV